MVIKLRLNEKSIADAIQTLNDYAENLPKRAKRIAEKLAEQGREQAQSEYSRAFYDGTNDVKVTVEKTDSGAKVIAQGNSVLFIEFGAGIIYGYGHPKPMGFGPGTYPGKGHWSNPQGWWYPSNGTNMSGNWTKSTKSGTQYTHTFGNPPSKSMYNTAQKIRQDAHKVAKEVFSDERH